MIGTFSPLQASSYRLIWLMNSLGIIIRIGHWATCSSNCCLEESKKWCKVINIINIIFQPPLKFSPLVVRGPGHQPEGRVWCPAEEGGCITLEWYWTPVDYQVIPHNVFNVSAPTKKGECTGLLSYVVIILIHCVLCTWYSWSYGIIVCYIVSCIHLNI